MVTDAKKESNKRYNDKQKRIVLQVPPSFFDDLNQYLLDHGIKSRTQFIKDAILLKMEHDKNKNY